MIILFLALSLLLIVAIEIIKRRTSLPTFITRRITHIGAALIASLSALFIEQSIIVLSCIGFAALLLVARSSFIFQSIQNVKRNTYGDVFLPLGEAASASIFLPHNIVAFQYGILVMGICDALAGLVGEKYGRHEFSIFGNKKSLEGSGAFFVSCFILTLIFLPGGGIYLLIIPLILTFIELLLGFGSDNLLLPLAAGFLIW